jgi:hypothetical protein
LPDRIFAGSDYSGKKLLLREVFPTETLLLNQIGPEWSCCLPKRELNGPIATQNTAGINLSPLHKLTTWKTPPGTNSLLDAVNFAS